jgi:hypothetical protein
MISRNEGFILSPVRHAGERRHLGSLSIWFENRLDSASGGMQESTSSRSNHNFSLGIRFGHTGLLFFCGHVGAAKRFGTVAHEHERLGADVGDLVVIFCGEKDDLVFLDNPFFSL